MAVPVFVNGDVPDEDDVNDWFVNVIFKRKPTNESVSSSVTLQNDNDLFFTIAANTIYRVTMVLYVSAQTANDAKIDFTLPAGASFNYMISTQTTTAAAYADDQIFPGTAGTPSGIGGLGGTGNAVAHIEGVLETAGTAGTFQTQWAQLVSGAGGTTFIAGSWLEARRVG